MKAFSVPDLRHAAIWMFAFSSAAALSSYMISGGVSIILVLVLNFYIVFGYQPVREFLYGQSVE